MKDYEIKIGAYTIPIRHRSKTAMRDAYDGDDETVFGSYHGGEVAPFISLWKKLYGVRYNGVLIHEVIEGINQLYAVGLKHRQIDVLGEVLGQVLHDSPKLKLLTNPGDLNEKNKTCEEVLQ